MQVNWPGVIVGSVAVVISVVLWLNRQRFYDVTIEGQRAMGRDKLARRMEERATPMTGIGVPAIGFGVIGVAAILASLF